MKRQVLQLLLANCSWANGALTATFNPPFDILADYVDMIGRRAGGLAMERGLQGFEFERFSTVFQHPNFDLRQFIARYNAMVRIQQDDAVGRTAMPLGIDLQAESA